MNTSNQQVDDGLWRHAASVTSERQPKRCTRVTVVVSDLACGGIQRAVVDLSAGWVQRGYNVSIVTFSRPDRDFFSVPVGVRRESLGKVNGQRTPPLALPSAIVRRLRLLKEMIDATRPDVVIAHAPHINVPTLIAAQGYPVIVTEHGDVSALPKALDSRGWYRRVWYALRHLAYPFAAKVVSVSHAVDQNVRWLGRERRTIIHNPLARRVSALEPSSLPAGAQLGRPWLVSVGRLSHAKGFDVLLDAFARIASRFPNWQLLIIGDGVMRAKLETQARGLRDQVIFAGALADPLPLLRHAQWFVMASRYEGFPIAHGEALSCGVPVIATDCPSRPRRWFETHPPAGGIRELLREHSGSILVPPEDPATLAEVMARCMSDGILRARLAHETRHAAERFSLPSVLHKWEALFAEVVSGRGR